MKKSLRLTLALLLSIGFPLAAEEGRSVDLSPTRWIDDYEAYMRAQLVDRSHAGVATGYNGAVTVAYNGLAARAGIEALKQGGNAIDAAATTALTQVALTAGAPVSYFGILSLVYYEAETGEVHTMNAEWNTVLGEDEPLAIPGGVTLSSMFGNAVSGRTALVGGFMKGIGAAHERFGSLPFAELFAPSIHVAEKGMPISKKMAGYLEARSEDLARLPETKAVFYKGDGTIYGEGEILRQPALAATLRAVADQGTDYMYRGPWAERLVAAVQADGGKMTLEDLASYEVRWDRPLVAELGDGYTLYTNPPPNNGGVGMIEAQRLARASGLIEEEHWSRSGESLKKALDITQVGIITFVPPQMQGMLFPGIDFSPESRVTPEHAEKLWGLIASGRRASNWKPQVPKHSDDVVAVDRWGNIAAITHTINAVLWGKTAIVVDGVSIGDPGSFQQQQIARAGPGNRLESPTETGVLFQNGKPALGFASMGSGLHQRTFQGLLGFMHFGMTVDQAIDAPDFFSPAFDPATFQTTFRVPAGKFSKDVLDATGYAYEELEPGEARLGGEGLWVAVSVDPETGQLRAASHNRNNSDAVAY